MKSQSLKLFAAAFVLGLGLVFASATSANAQDKISFDIPFEFHVGSKKLAAGKYEFTKIGEKSFSLRNAETGDSRIVVFPAMTGKKGAASGESIVFNRYDKTYFLSSLFDVRANFGRQILETGYEKKIRRGMTVNENQLADKKKTPEQVSVNSNRR
jgi:hypothetical protein